MGIQLDWQIESERQSRQATEDPNAKYVRRKKRRRLFLSIFLLAMAVCGLLGTVLWRLRSVDNQLRQNLLDTVDAEVRAIRIGNENNYMNIRRSSSDYWIDLQRQDFAEYQQLKNAGQLQLIGNVLDVEMDVDESRARVLVEEVIDGTSYERVWFYWYYGSGDQSGWRRVPPDVDFWGDEKTLERDRVEIQYRELDEDLAQALADYLGQWWREGCQWLSCPIDLPRLKINIEPRSAAAPVWDLNDEWRIVLTSPLYEGRVPRTQRLSPELELWLADMIAERIANYALNPGFTFVALPYSDAEWMFEELQTWLIGRFIAEPTMGSPFFENMVLQYGEGAPGLFVRLLGQDSQLGPSFQQATGVAIPSISLEILNTSQVAWHSFFKWRLAAEQRILKRERVAEDQVINKHNDLYDVNDGFALANASIYRDQFNPSLVSADIVSVNFSKDEVGNLLAAVNMPTQVAVFRWVGTTWKRVS